MPNENSRRYMDVDSLEALWDDTGQLISNLVENAAQDISDVAVQQAQAAADDSIRAAIDAVGDISELAVPLMSADTRGGATLGTGLRVDDGKLSLGDIVTDSCDGPIYSVYAEGWSEQVSTTGKNLWAFGDESFTAATSTSPETMPHKYTTNPPSAGTYSVVPSGF